MRVRTTLVAALTSAAILIPPSTGPAVAEEGTHSPNMSHVETIPYGRVPFSTITNGGTDIEFTTLEVVKRDASGNPICVPSKVKKKKGARGCATDASGNVIYVTESREYALAGSYDNGLHIFDITNPEDTTLVSRYDCRVRQGDVQVFDRDGRTYVTYTYDSGYSSSVETQCFQEAMALGLHPQRDTGNGLFGTFIADITDPTDPTTVSFVPEPRGSHNQTVAPGGNYLYNSNSDLNASGGHIEIFDISDFSAPVKVKTLDLQTGLSSHDITFSEDGTRAYTAAVTHTLVLDTTNLADPTIVGRIIDPAVNIHHQSDPVTLTDENTGLTKTFLIVTDELAGAAGNAVCPGGGLHVYDISGQLERNPVKVGVWNMPDVQLQSDTLTCTSHVLRLYPEEELMTIAWYAAGVRVVDISNLIGVSVGADRTVGNVGLGMEEIGYQFFPNSDTWSVKTNRIEEDGSFYMYGNDQERGFDIYRFDGTAPQSANAGTWMSAEESLALAQARGCRATRSPARTACTGESPPDRHHRRSQGAGPPGLAPFSHPEGGTPSHLGESSLEACPRPTRR